eukprot:TRINITY_DN45579_c0_g1_i1.p1 TRINITY_DN45579_c0_g1~~TRINITY_DN45579_c0_g1_i1.p1  ORF type:complete len:227 (+),score=60.63 TRINITY_DN45579_c0_g1_i1:75-683(+)
MQREFTWQEIAGRDRAAGLWVVMEVDGEHCVYDVTDFLEEHPGGEEVLEDRASRDVTDDFDMIGHSQEAKAMRDKLCIGKIGRPKVLRVGDAELGDSALDAALSDLGIAAESSVELLRVPNWAHADSVGQAGPAGSCGMQIYVTAHSLGVEETVCVEVKTEATARDLVAAAVGQLRNMGCAAAQLPDPPSGAAADGSRCVVS